MSIGQAAFYGSGAYLSAILTVRSGFAPFLAMALGAFAAGAGGWVVGKAIFRARGHYLAMATLAFGLVAFFVAKELDVTGGPSGLPGIPKLGIGTFALDSDFRYYWLVAGVLFVVVLLAENLVRSRVGRALRAIGDSEVAAATSGVEVARHKVVVFVVGAMFTSVAGSLYAHWVTYVDPSVADLLLSIQLVIMATVGGLRSVWGAPIGAFVIVTLSQWAREVMPRLFPRAGGEYEITVYGIALIVILLFVPDGIAGGVSRLLSGRRARIAVDPEGPPGAVAG